MPIPLNPFDLAPHTAPRAADLNTIFSILYDALDKTQVGLGTDNFEDDAFTVAKFPAIEAWQSITLGGMKPAGPFAAPQLRFYKDQVGIVHLDPSWVFGPGAVITVGTLLATFPAGYRPGFTTNIIFHHVDDTPAYAAVAANGQMTMLGGGAGDATGGQYYLPSPARYHFSGASWLAEN